MSSEIETRLRERLGVLQEEANAQRMLIAHYQKIYAELAAEHQPPPHTAPSTTSQEMSDQYFLIIGNGRTGSTWLETSFNQLPDVRAYRQIGWRLGDQPGHPQRYSINKSDSMASIIKSACDDKEPTRLAIAGSKFIFQPYTFTHTDVFEQLCVCIEPQIKLIHLKRSYLSSFLSWKIRGVAHKIDSSVNAIQRVPLSVESHPAAEPRHLVLAARGGPLSDIEGTRYPLNTAIDDIAMMFSNDIFSRRLVEQRGGLTIDYADITKRFSELARFVGSQAPDEKIREIVAQPLTMKLDNLENYLHPLTPLSEIADLFDKAYRDNDPDSIIWRSDNLLRLSIPGLRETLEKYGANVEDDGDAILWRPRKPIMLI